MSSNKFPSIVYCATREKDLKEIEKSVLSVRNFYTEIEIILVTTFKSYKNNLINKIQYLKAPQLNFLDKISAIIEIRRKKILFLDGDTFLIEKIDDLFQLLDKFDLAVAHAPNRWTHKLEKIPDSYPEFNTGVLLIRKSFRVRRFLRQWFKDYQSDLSNNIDFPSKDQIAFRTCLYNSKIRYATLTPEYNCRFTMGAMVSHSVKVLHGRTDNLEDIQSRINDTEKNKWSGEPIVRWIKYS